MIILQINHIPKAYVIQKFQMPTAPYLTSLTTLFHFNYLLCIKTIFNNPVMLVQNKLKYNIYLQWKLDQHNIIVNTKKFNGPHQFSINVPSIIIWVYLCMQLFQSSMHKQLTEMLCNKHNGLEWYNVLLTTGYSEQCR